MPKLKIQELFVIRAQLKGIGMENRSLGKLVLPVAFVIVLLFPRLSSTGPPGTEGKALLTAQPAQTSKPQKEGSRTNRNPYPPHSAAYLLHEFLGEMPSQPAATWREGDRRRAYSIEFLIATVPDPLDSRLPYLYDRYLDSIQRALEVAGYLPDLFDLPWFENSGPTREGQVSEARRYEYEPGVVLFRNSRDMRLLSLFLVGETPTSGIHKAALLDALNQIAQLGGWHRLQPETGSRQRLDSQPGAPHWLVRLMSPSFSGSAESLEFVLRTWFREMGEPEHLEFRIVSGSATAIDKSSFFMLGKDRPIASFHSTVIPDQPAFRAFFNFLETLDSNNRHRIAVLAEGNTVYGQHSRSMLQAKTRETDPSSRDPEKPLWLTFPLHISQLRSASEKTSPLRKEGSSQLTSSTTPFMPIALAESSEPRDVLPVTSKLETSSVELVLATLLSTISREGIRYVGLLATDVRDRILLAREIRQHCPQAVLFTFSSDLLYLHPDVNQDLRGMLVATPYPLFNLNQFWSYPWSGDRARLQFPNHTSQGVYNAILALLGHSEEMLEYGPPFCSEKTPGDKTAPPLWIAQVGRDQLWPVRLLNYSDKEGYLYPVLSQPLLLKGRDLHLAQGGGSEFELSALLLVGLLCAIPSWLVLQQFPLRTASLLKRWRRRLSEKTNWLTRLSCDLVFRPYRNEYRLYLLLAISTLLGLYLVIVTAFFLQDLAALNISLSVGGTSLAGGSSRGWLGAYAAYLGWSQSVSYFLGMVLLRLFLLSVLMLCVCSGFNLCRILVMGMVSQRKNRRLSSGRPFITRFTGLNSALALSAGTLLTLVFCVRLCYSWILTARQEPVTAFFIHLRSSSLFSGLSPLLPLLMIASAGFLWSVCCLRRLRMMEELDSSTSVLGFQSASFTGSLEQEGRVRRCLYEPVFSLPGSLVLVFLLGFPCYRIFLVRLVHTVEGSAYDALFGVVFFVVYVALSLSFLRFLCVWRELRLLLRRMAWHPLRSAYPEFREQFPTVSKIELTAAPPSLGLLEMSVDQAGKVLRLSRELASDPLSSMDSPDLRSWLSSSLGDLDHQVNNSEAHLAASLQAEATGQWRKALRLRRTALESLATLSKTLSSALEPYWHLAGSAIPPKLEIRTGEKKWQSLAEGFLVSRIVHLLALVFAQMQNLVYFVMVGLLLMLLAVITYPFQPSDLLLLYNWSIILAFVALTLIVFVQIDRDAVLSLLSGTTPGRVTWDRAFVFRILTYAFLPISALLGAQFPDVLRQAISWISSSEILK